MIRNKGKRSQRKLVRRPPGPVEKSSREAGLGVPPEGAQDSRKGAYLGTSRKGQLTVGPEETAWQPLKRAPGTVERAPGQVDWTPGLVDNPNT